MTPNTTGRRGARAPLVTLTALVLLLGAGGTAARPYAPGLSYRMRTVLSLPAMPGGGGGDMVIVGHGVSLGAHSRLDIDSVTAGTPGSLAAGDYLLVLDSDRVLAVNPASKTYTDGFSMGNSLPPELMSQASISNIVVNVEKLGAGDTVEGRPTDKYRMSAQYTLNIMGQGIGFDSQTDFLMANLPTKITSPLSGGMSKTMSTGLFAELYGKMMDAQKQLGGGSAVRTTTTTNINGPMTMTMTQNVQVTDIKATDVDEKSLQIPDGFTVKPPMP